MAHKAKGFFYVSLGILALAVAFHLGARSAGASYVPPGETGIVGFQCDGFYNWVLTDLGSGEWTWTPTSGWVDSGVALPVPISEIKFWQRQGLVTLSNELWFFDSIGGWQYVGPPPGLETSVERTTWGRVKAETGR